MKYEPFEMYVYNVYNVCMLRFSIVSISLFKCFNCIILTDLVVATCTLLLLLMNDEFHDLVGVCVYVFLETEF